MYQTQSIVNSVNTVSRLWRGATPISDNISNNIDWAGVKSYLGNAQIHGPLFKSGLPLSSMSFHLLDDSQIAHESSAQGCEIIILARETTSFENSS